MRKTKLASQCLIMMLLGCALPVQVHAAGFLDRLKNAAEDVRETLPEAREIQKSLPELAGSEAQAGESASAGTVQTAAPGDSANLINSTAYLMDRWPYDGTRGKPVKELVLRGVYLGQPLPEAHQALLDAGFSYLNPGPAAFNYRMFLIEVGGVRKWIRGDELTDYERQSGYRALRRLDMTVAVHAPSAPMLAELPAYPHDAVGALPVLMQSTDPRYVHGIGYQLKFLSGEKVDWPALMAQAQDQYGVPNNSAINAAAKGVPYQWQYGPMIWVDAALAPRQQIEAVLASARPEEPYNSIRQMVWKDMMLPGMPENMAYNKDIVGGLDNVIAALRLAGAPDMTISTRNARFNIEASWPFLRYERTVRELYAKDQEREQQPTAEVNF